MVRQWPLTPESSPRGAPGLTGRSGPTPGGGQRRGASQQGRGRPRCCRGSGTATASRWGPRWWAGSGWGGCCPGAPPAAPRPFASGASSAAAPSAPGAANRWGRAQCHQSHPGFLPLPLKATWHLAASRMGFATWTQRFGTAGPRAMAAAGQMQVGMKAGRLGSLSPTPGRSPPSPTSLLRKQ